MTEETFQWLLRAEGGYVNHPNDPGGETNLGITIATFNRAKQANLIKSPSLKLLTREDAKTIYEQYYWKPSQAVLLPDPIGTIYFDMVINSGGVNAVRTLCRAIAAMGTGLKQYNRINGFITDEVEKIVKDGRVGILAKSLLNRRMEFYEAIIKRRPASSVFRNGWLNRLKRLAVHCKIAWFEG